MDINIIPKFLDEALTPVAKETGERLSDIVSLVFTPIIKAKAVRDKKLDLFLKDLEQEVNCIPEDKLQDPELHIIGPALEDVGKYYHDKDFLRKKFAKLVAASLDSRKTEFVHPMFKDIIEKLSENDAELLDSMYNDKEPRILYSMPAKQVAFSLNILEELGLIKIDKDQYDRLFTAKERIYDESFAIEISRWERERSGLYSKYENFKVEFTQDYAFVRPFEEIMLNDLDKTISVDNIISFKIYFPFTLLGERFCKVCVKKST